MALQVAVIIPEQPCSKPTNTNVTAITTTEATLGWDAVNSATSYDVRFKLLGSPWGSWVYTYGITTNQLTQTGLASGTWYHWQVRAVCGSSSNMSGFTSYNTFTTLSGSRINGEENSLSSNLSVYPNPTNGEVNIKFISEELNNFEISIVDAFGKLILKDKEKEFIGEFTKKVDLSTYPRGIYMIQIKTIDSVLTKRIVLQ